MSTNLQKISVKISWHADVWSTSYSDLSDASFDILKTMDSKQFRVLIYHCFSIKKKTQCKLSSGLKSATTAVCTLFCMNICLWGSCCQSECRVCSRWIKNDNVSLIPSAVWSCFAEINRIFCVGMSQWTKPESITTLRSQSGRQPSGLQSVRSAQSSQKRKCGPVRLWPQYFGMLMEFCSSTTLTKVRRSIANVTLAN